MSLATILEKIQEIENETAAGANTKERVGLALRELLPALNFEIKEIALINGTQATGIGKSLTLPSGVISIQDYAFDDKALSELTLPDSLQEIGSFAFRSNIITSVVLNEGLLTLGNSAFQYNPLQSATIPSTLQIIPYGAFMYTNTLSELILNEGLITIESNAFEGNKLASLIIPSTVTSIGSMAFNQGFDNLLPAVTLPAGCTYTADTFPSATVVTGGTLV